MGSAGYSARRRARKKASRESAHEAREKARREARRARGLGESARPAEQADPARRRRRELEDYAEEILAGYAPAHAAGNPSFREFLRSQVRSMSDEALAAYSNLSSGGDDDDEAAMSRDMDLIMDEMMGASPKKIMRGIR